MRKDKDNSTNANGRQGEFGAMKTEDFDRREAENGLRPKFRTTANGDKRFLPKLPNLLQENLFKIALLVVSAAFIVIGIVRGEHMTVLQKAVRVCMECIGLG